MENSYCAVASGRGGAETRQGTRRPPNPKRRSPSSRSSPLFFFSILAVENGEIQSSCVVGERRSQSRFVVGSSGKKKTSQPKTTSFWGYCFFLNQNTQNDVVLRCFIFIFKNDKPKTASFWASSNQNDAVLGCLSLQPYKTLLFFGFHPKTLKKAFKNTLKSGLKMEEEEDSKRYFFFIFPIFVVKKILIKVEKHC